MSCWLNWQWAPEMGTMQPDQVNTCDDEFSYPWYHFVINVVTKSCSALGYDALFLCFVFEFIVIYTRHYRQVYWIIFYVHSNKPFGLVRLEMETRFKTNAFFYFNYFDRPHGHKNVTEMSWTKIVTKNGNLHAIPQQWSVFRTYSTYHHSIPQAGTVKYNGSIEGREGGGGRHAYACILLKSLRFKVNYLIWILAKILNPFLLRN